MHEGEVILELETELKPSLIIGVVLDRFRSKLRDFCDVCRRHITAPQPCASFSCSVTRSTTTEFQHNDIMMKTTVQNDLRLEMALESMWIVCAHEKSNNLETTENKRACASNCTLTSTSLSLHKSGSTGLFHTSSCRKHFDFLKVEVQDTVAHNQGFAHLCDLFHNLWNWNINDLLRSSRFPYTYHAYQMQQLKHRLYVLLNHAVPAMDSFHGVTPRIRTDWIRTALNGRLNEALPVCSRG